MTERKPSTVSPMPPLNEIRRTDATGPEVPVLPTSLSAHFRQQGMTWRPVDQPETVAVVDRGHRMHAFSRETTQVVAAMVVAAECRGWKSLDVSGTDTFRRAAYVEATARGIEVSGYEPSPADRSAGNRGAELMASLRNPRVQAYLKAESPAERKTASAAYPGLDRAFAAEDVARRTLESRPNVGKAAVDAFMTRFRENTAIALDKGRSLPDIGVPKRPNEVRR